MKHFTLLALLFCSKMLFSQGFVNMAPDLGLDYSFGPVAYGGGVSFVDFNQDGLDDLTFTSSFGSPIHFHINTGNGFEEITPPVNNTTETKQPIWVDYDNDGDLDMWISGYQLNRLYRNDGNLTFVDVTTTCGFNDPTVPSFNGSWFDYDEDGYPDLVTAHRPQHLVGDLTLYHNLGNGTFEDTTIPAGVGGGIGNSVLAIATLDFNNDGWEDIFVGQDFQAGCLMLKNKGDGTFENVSVSSGANIQNNTMTVTVGDYDNNGFFDVFITDTGGDGCSLLTNNGDETFTDLASSKGVILNKFTWGASFFDADNDMDLDLHVDGKNYSPYTSYMFENPGSADPFINANVAWGFGTDDSESIGNAVGDYNGDGYPELVKNNSNSDVNTFWVNNFSENNYLTVNLTGTISNNFAIGSVLHLYAGGVHQMRRVGCGEGFCSQHSYTQFFGLGSNAAADSLIINWPSGLVTSLYNVNANEDLFLIEEQIAGCTDPLACNYNILAAEDDGSCTFPETYLNCGGNCINDNDLDGICNELEIAGCSDLAACNYNELATDDDGSCVYAELYLDCEGNCILDSDLDGVCDEMEIAGCTDVLACNFLPDATDDDGTCEYFTAITITGETQISTGSTEIYTCEFAEGSTYEWMVINATILNGQGTNEVEIIFDSPGQASVTVIETTTSGCVGDEISLTIEIFSSVFENDQMLLKAYPNPVNAILTIDGFDPGISQSIQMVSSLGQIVHSELITRQQVRINTSNLPSGLYELFINKTTASGVRVLVVHSTQ